MTNQPRSSKVAAAVDLPAPDKPTRIRYSAIVSILPSARSQTFKAQQQQSRDGGLELEIDRTLEERQGRYRLFKACEHAAEGGDRVYVPRKGAVGERKPHARINLFRNSLLNQIGTDAPVVLAHDLVVHESHSPSPGTSDD